MNFIHVQVLLTAVLIATVYAKVKKNNGQLRIQNGDDTTKYPHVVALKCSKVQLMRICTGSLITSTWVITAGHCIIREVDYIQYGDITIMLAETSDKSRVIKMIAHPRFIMTLLRNDIGMVQIEEVSSTKLFSLSALDCGTLLGLPMVYVGYGRTHSMKFQDKMKVEKFVQDLRRPLQIAGGIVKKCDADNIISKQLICVSSKCNNRTQLVLHGDSGGPLLHDDKIVGVACAVAEAVQEQMFTPVSPYVSWIQTVMNG